MAMPDKYGVDKSLNSMAGLSAYENGGKGSGNFGHSGRPGKIGGSGSGNSSDILSPRPKKSEETSGQTEEAKKVEFAQLMARSEKLRRQIALTQEAINETDDEIFADELGGDVGQGTSWLMSRSMEYEDELKSLKSELIDVRKRLKKIADDLSSEQKNGLVLNGGKGSGNFGHAGRPGKRGGSGSGSGISKAIATQKKFQDQAKIVQEDIEDRIGQKVKKGEEYTALDEASKSRFKEFHGEDGTEYTYDKENGMITKTNPETGDQEVVTKQKDSSFHSRYEGGSAPIQYDGDTFYPDKDGRGMTTKDGKRTMMFPDEVLHARQQIVDNWKKEGLTETSYEHAKELYFKTKKDSTIADQDMRDKKTAIELASELGTIIREYEDEHPERFLK